MNKLKLFMYVFVAFVNVTCNAQNDADIDFSNCINQSTEFYSENPDIDFYEMMDEVEQVILTEMSKRSFKRFIEKIYEDSLFEEKAYSLMQKVFNKYNYDYTIFNTKVLIDCPYLIVSKYNIGKGTTLYKQSMKVEEIRKKGYLDSKDLFNELVDLTPKNDFKEIKYRTPILLGLVNKMIVSRSLIKKQ